MQRLGTVVGGRNKGLDSDVSTVSFVRNLYDSSYHAYQAAGVYIFIFWSKFNNIFSFGQLPFKVQFSCYDGIIA